MQVPSECRDRAGPMRRAVHDRGVELDNAENVRPPPAADARVGGVGLDELRARLDRVERGAASRQDADTGGQRRRAVSAGDHDRRH